MNTGGRASLFTLRFLAHFIGLFTVLLIIGLLICGGATVEAAVADAPVMFVYALIGFRMQRLARPGTSS
jgi:hypothetical protein